MGLADYLNVLYKYWISIVTAAVIGVLLAATVTALAAPRYQASSQVFVSVRAGDDSVGALVAGRNFSAEQVASYTELVSSPRVLEPVIEDLGLADTPQTLAARVSAERPQNTVLINIVVEDESASVAARAANSIAGSLAVVVPELEMDEGSDAPPVEISTIREAVPPSTPVSPRPALNIALGLVAGLIVGVGIAVLRDVLDTRVRTVADVEAITGASVIGTIGYEADAPDHPLIVQESPQSQRAEAFRRLRTNLKFLEVGSSSRCFVVVSALPGEGKSTTSINLAITLADAGSRVVIVDGDLRRPSVSGYLGLEGSVGLTTVLIGKVSLDDALQPWGNDNLHVLPSGQIPPNPSELLGSTQMTETIESLIERYDVVLIDSAPLLPVTDGAILAKMTGGAIVVVGAGIAHKTHVQEAAGSLRTVGAHIVGMVLNRTPVPERSPYRYGYTSDVSDESRSGSAGSGATSQVPARHGRRRGLIGELLGGIRDSGEAARVADPGPPDGSGEMAMVPGDAARERGPAGAKDGEVEVRWPPVETGS